MTRHILAMLAFCVTLFADPITGGKYTGKWEGVSGGAGDFQLMLTPAAEGKWESEVSFGLGGQEVKCKVKSLSVADSKLQVVYTFDLGGTELESTIEGELAGKRLAGKYRTRVVADGSPVDEGTWETTSAN
jgi:hypothetical protein